MDPSVIPLSNPDITDAERQAVAEVMCGGRLALGPRMKAFEEALAERTGRQFGVAVNSGTSGLHLCVRALNIGEGDEVITTPFSFVATTNCLLFEGAKPVFVDIDPDSYNMDPDLLEGALTEQTKAILPVEVFGCPAHFDRYEEFAQSRGLAMIEDSCEALGAILAGRAAGGFGDCSVFAFYPNKQITTGEGGMIVTDREDIRDLCVSLRNQGRSGADWLEHSHLGYNYRMSELTAALGLAQLQRLDQILQRRRRVAEAYRQALSGIEGIHLPPCTDPETASWFVYVVRLANEFGADQRDEVVQALRSRGVQCGRYFPPIHLQPFIRARFGFRKGDFPVCERISERTIALPFFAAATDEQVERVAAELLEAITRV